MKIAIYSRPEILTSETKLTELIGVLDKYLIDYYLNRSTANILSSADIIHISEERIYDNTKNLPTDVDMIISYGGDGTFLDSVRLVNNMPIPILGINSGRLGFLANVSEEEIETAVQELIGKKYSVEKRTTLFVEGNFGEEIDYPYAFNEFSIQKKGVTMVAVDVYIDDEFIATYMGDGMILSTPSGSTAYSLSVGGPIVAPNCGCFVISPIASHNLTIRPLVVHDTSSVKLSVRSRNGKAYATLDNRDYEIENENTFTIKKSEKSVFLIKLNNISFYRTLRDKMMWGIDSREIKK